MSIKSKVFAASAALTMVGTVGTVGLLTQAASAATPSCGDNCATVFSRTFGHHTDPAFVLDVWRQASKAGQAVILYRQSQYDPAEDFVIANQGTVSDFYEAGLVSPALVLHYGGGCTTLDSCGMSGFNDTFPDDYAFEIEYAPYGVQSGLCAGVASVAGNKTPISLQPCGVSSRTVWVSDTSKAVDCDGGLSISKGYAPLINGSDTNFSHPYVMTYPMNGYPTDKPRPQLFTETLTGFSGPGGIDPFDAPSTVNDNQLWGVDGGALTGPEPGCPVTDGGGGPTS
jgi:hypothetical protein